MDNIERIRTGFSAIDFSLVDSSGESYRLFDFLGKKMVVLVFVPKSPRQNIKPFLKRWEEVLPCVKNQTKEVLVISSEHSIRAHHLKKELDLTFPILWDKGSIMAELYGILNRSSFEAYPAVFLVDKEGIIRYKEVFVNLEQMPRLDNFLQWLKG